MDSSEPGWESGTNRITGLTLKVLELRCELDKPWARPPRPGANDATTLRGSFGSAIHSNAALQPLIEAFKPSSRIFPGQAQSPVLLRAGPTNPTGTLMALRVVIFGRATSQTDLLFEALRKTGEAGLDSPAGRVRFAIARSGDPLRFHGTVGHWVRCSLSALNGCHATAARVRFETPCDARAMDVPSLCGNAAFHAARLELIDREPEIDPSCDSEEKARAEGVRTLCESAFVGVVERSRELTEVTLGTRTSGKGQGRFSLHGSMGEIVLGGALAPCLPWLSLMALWGVGGRRAMGMGDVSVQLAPDE